VLAGHASGEDKRAAQQHALKLRYNTPRQLLHLSEYCGSIKTSNTSNKRASKNKQPGWLNQQEYYKYKAGSSG
jgi:hypothetical protein